jgi:hypothetical protein
MMVHGGWGVGKTWLVHSMPGPRLILDTEGGWEDVEVPTLLWDPLSEPLPTGIDEDTSVIVEVTDLPTMKEAIRVLKTGEHSFVSFGLDSLTESQKQLKTRVADLNNEYDPNAIFDQQAWGRLLNHGELIVRDLRDLTRAGATKRMHGLVVMGSDTEMVPIKPLLQGALRKSLAGFFRLEGYLFRAVNDGGEDIRVMNISPAQGAEAKSNLHLVNMFYKDNNYQIRGFPLGS